jgi:hypothetical protein
MMIAILRWAAPAALFVGVLGCGQESASTKKPPAAPPTKAEATPLTAANAVTLKVDGMV